MTTPQQHQNPKITWAQNRRSINISYLIRNNNYGAPSVLFNNDNSVITLQCQGCLPNENPSETVRNFEITLNLFAPVFAIDATDQIKVTEKYIRINLFKKSRKSWEKLINVDEQKKRTTIDRKTDDDDDNDSSVSIMNFYGRNHKTAIIYDWDLDAVMERQMKEALEEAGMLDEDFSTSSDGDSNCSDDGNYDDTNSTTKKKGFKSPSSFNTDTGFDGGESGNCSTATAGRVNSLLQNRKKNLKKKTSRVSKDPVYGDHVPTSSSSSSSDSDSAVGNNNNNNLNNNENTYNNSSSDDKMFGPRRPNAKEQQHQQQVQQQKRMQQVALKQMHELNKTLPVGQRRSLTDRQILVLVIGIGAICALVGGFLSASVVYWKMGTVAVSPELIEKVVEKQQQKQNSRDQPIREQQKVEQETKVMEKESSQ